MSRTITKNDMINPRQRFNAATVAAAKALARSKPWQGDFDKRWADLTACFNAMATAYGLEGWTLVHEGSRSGLSGSSRIDPDRRRVVLTGRLSVVSMFWGLSLARREPSPRAGFEALRWAVTLFAKRFPMSFERCELVGGLLINSGRRDD